MAVASSSPTSLVATATATATAEPTSSTHLLPSNVSVRSYHSYTNSTAPAAETAAAVADQTVPTLLPGAIAGTATAIEPISTTVTSLSTSTSNTGIGSPMIKAQHSTEPEGGLRAWLVVLGSFMIHCFVFGPTEYAYGVFQDRYQVDYPDATASSIAFIGSTGSATTYIAGFLAGFVADRLGYKATALMGTVTMAVSLVLASFATQLWHLYLTQGVLFGIGASLTYYPAIAAPSNWFKAKRGMATGLAVSGVGLGGLALAPLTQALIDHADIAWTLRALAGIGFIFCAPASFLISEKRLEMNVSKEQLVVVDPEQEAEIETGVVKVKKEKQSFLTALKIFKNPEFFSLTAAEFAASFGFLIPLYFMQTYAVHIGLTPSAGALIIGLSNGASCMGRISLGYAADHFQKTRVLLVCGWGTAFAVLVLWSLSKSFAMLLIMALTFGFFGGGYVSLIPVVISETFGTEQIASLIGFLYASASIGMLVGPVVSGAILDSTLPDLNYLPVIMTAGSTLLIGALCITTWVIYFNRRRAREAKQAAKEEIDAQAARAEIAATATTNRSASPTVMTNAAASEAVEA